MTVRAISRLICALSEWRDAGRSTNGVELEINGETIRSDRHALARSDNHSQTVDPTQDPRNPANHVFENSGESTVMRADRNRGRQRQRAAEYLFGRIALDRQ